MLPLLPHRVLVDGIGLDDPEEAKTHAEEHEGGQGQSVTLDRRLIDEHVSRRGRTSGDAIIRSQNV